MELHLLSTILYWFVFALCGLGFNCVAAGYVSGKFILDARQRVMVLVLAAIPWLMATVVLIFTAVSWLLAFGKWLSRVL